MSNNLKIKICQFACEITFFRAFDPNNNFLNDLLCNSYQYWDLINQLPKTTYFAIFKLWR